MNTKYKIGFVGLTHLGFVTSIGMVSLKKKIIAVDQRINIINSLKNGKVLLMEGEHLLKENDLDKLFKQNKHNYFPTNDFGELSKCNAVFFAIDTPTDGKGSQDNLDNLLDLSIPNFKDGSTIIIMSQVPIGFCRQIKNKISNKRPGLKFSLYHWVDTIIMTNAVERFVHPERIIIGKENQNKLNFDLKNILKLFKCPVYEMSYEGAEITKAFINLYLANSVTYANTLADYCEKFGANINEIIPALRSDKRIGMYAYLKPTLSIAGGHLERDLIMLERLAKKNKLSQKLISLIIKQNQIRYKWALKLINKNSIHLKHKPTICFWGLAYKTDTSSVKNASSIKIIKDLQDKAIIQAYDPMAEITDKNIKIKRLGSKYSALKGADCLLITTEWNEFKNVDVLKMYRLMKGKVIIDCVGILNQENINLSKFKYFALGLGQSF